MNNLRTILRFGWFYLRPYWARLTVGVLVGVLFGLLNASFVWAMKTLIERMNTGSSGEVAHAHPRFFTVTVNRAAPLVLAGEGNAPTNLVWALVTQPTNGALSGFDPRAGKVTYTPGSNFQGADSFIFSVGNGAWNCGPVVASLTVANLPAARFGVRAKLYAVQTTVNRALDPWLPVMGRKPDTRQIIGGLLFLPILVFLRGAAGYLSSYCLSWASERAMSDLRVDLVAKLGSLSLDFFNRSRMGDLLKRVNEDVGLLQRVLSFGFSDLVKEPVTIVGLFAGLCLVNWQLTLFSMLFFGLCVVPLLVLGRKLGRAARAGVSAGVQQANLLVEFLAGVRVIKAFNLEADQIGRFRKVSRELVRHTMKAVQMREQANPIIETIAMTGVGVLLVFIFATHKSLPDVVAFLTGVAMIYQPVKKLSTVHLMLKLTGPGVERLVQLLEEKVSVREAVAPAPLAPFARAVEFRSVNFAYAGTPVLRDLSLVIPRGMKLGIAGESGSGKSTLVNLLFRFYDPTSGSITMDGRDLREMSTADLRKQLALVSQEIVIFDQTAAENIACGRPGATRAEVETAARAADAHDFIARLPQGYDTMVGERGMTLSGGQRQRLAIARAFIRNAPILVLDEATASLDSQSEGEVQAAIERIEQNRTVVCVAHRLSTLANMDKIIVLSQGQIVEEGTFNELLQRGGTFADMARRQGIFAERAS